MGHTDLPNDELNAAARLLAECAAVATAEGDAAFPEERLARQRARILHRIEHEGRPARVISFPAAHAVEPTPLRTRPAMRWIAAAAAAGLIIGVFAGHLAHDLERPRGLAVQAERAVAPAASVRTVAGTTGSDEEFLLRVDRAVERGGARALGPLDQLTPRVWEVAVR